MERPMSWPFILAASGSETRLLSCTILSRQIVAHLARFVPGGA